MKIPVAGGAGYIGSHTCKALAGKGHSAVIFDGLSSGFCILAKWGVFECGDLGNR
jgi:UDP-glucose 4-epimerase